MGISKSAKPRTDFILRTHYKSQPLRLYFYISCFVYPVHSLPLWDHEGVAISSATLSTVTLTYTQFAGGATINSRSAQNVKNTNNCTVNTSGEFVWNLRAEDTAISDSGIPVGQTEKHIAVFTWTWTDANTVAQVGKHIATISVENV